MSVKTLGMLYNPPQTEQPKPAEGEYKKLTLWDPKEGQTYISKNGSVAVLVMMVDHKLMGMSSMVGKEYTCHPDTPSPLADFVFDYKPCKLSIIPKE